MIYTPGTEKLWDCWIYPYNGQYYLYYLSLSAERFGKGSWDGISLAISDDLVHWREYGRVLEKRPEASWIGTGMIQKRGDLYIMNFSEEIPPGTQNIFFAQSRDLIHWERTGHRCAPDGVYYMNKSDDMSNSIPRWDSLGIVDALEDGDPPYYAFCTASGKGGALPNKNGALGFVTSEDGLNWQCLPGAFPDLTQFPHFEVPEHVCFHGRHYVLFCTSSYLSFRFDSRARDMSGGTFYVVSDELAGPYRLPDADPMLQGTRDHPGVSTVSVGRPLRQGEQIFYYHIWGANGPDGWMGTVKLLEEAAPYRLQLRYNPVNDCLRHTLLAKTADILPGLSLVKQDSPLPPMRFELDKELVFTNLGTSAALRALPLPGCGRTDSAGDLRDGRYITFTLRLGEGEGAGIFFESESGEKLCAMLNRKRGRVEFGRLWPGWGPNIVIRDEICRETEIGACSHVRLLVRRCFWELYIDDLYISSWRPEQEIDPDRMGFYFEDCSGSLSELEIWQMG